jgi:hypothetical protein
VLQEIHEHATLAAAAYAVLPPPRRDAIARRVLKTSGLSDSYTLYLLSWLTSPTEREHRLLRAIWARAANESDLRQLVVAVAYRWEDIALLRHLFADETEEAVRDEALWAMAVLGAPAAYDLIAHEVRTRWNAACAADGRYADLDVSLFSDSGLRSPKPIQQYMTRISASPGAPTLLDELRVDASLCPQLQYALLGYASSRHNRGASAAVALFERVAATNPSREVRSRLLVLMARCGAGNELLERWEAAVDPWERDDIAAALIKSFDRRALRVLRHMLHTDWYARFHESEFAVPGFQTLLIAVLMETGGIDVIQAFLADSALHADYRAQIGLQVADWACQMHFLPEIEGLLAGGLSDTTRKELEEKVRRVKSRLRGPT